MAERLPDFLIIGAAKAGTTSLWRWLGAHPDVYVPHEKEVHFFDRDVRWALGPAWYATHFDGAGDAKRVGEATPEYLTTPAAPARVAAIVPHAQLIVVLRDPVDRAYSHYWHVRAWGGEPRTFEEVVEATLRGDPGVRNYLGHGRYLEHLKRYEEHFPRKQFLALRFEDVVDRPRAAFADVCRFLSVPDVAPRNLGVRYNQHNSLRSRWLRFYLMDGMRLWRRTPRLARVIDRLNTQEREYPPMEPRVRALLTDYYADANAALGTYLDWDLSTWSRPREQTG